MKRSFSIFSMVLILTTFLIGQAFAATEWYVTRPSSPVEYHQTIGNVGTDNIASVGLGVEIIEWVEQSPTFQYKDYLSFRVCGSGNTRTGIHYTVTSGGLSFWYGSSTPTGIVSDDQTKEFDLPYGFTFYGKEYRSVYVCSNGFLSFDSSSTSWSPKSIPNSASPNTLVAGFWRDLNPAKSGSITYYSGWDSSNLYVFAVTWNSVPNYINNNKQTFQIILRESRLNYEDDIIFSYLSITKDVYTTVGIEDQTGYKGTPYSYNNLQNYRGLTFQCGVLPKTISYLTIKVEKYGYGGDSYSAINIQTSENGGYNVKLKKTTNPLGDLFVLAIKTGAGLLIGGYAGLIVKGILVTSELAHILSRELSPPLLVGEHSCSRYDTMAYIKAEGYLEDPSDLYLYDSDLATTFIWVFYDTGWISHTVKVTAEMQYYDWAAGSKTVSSSVYMSVLKNTGGDPCPTLFTWNGEEYVDEGVLDIHGSSDVTVRHVVPKENLAPENGKLMLSLRELDEYTSHIDYIKLFAAYDNGLTRECHLTKAEHNKLGNVKRTLMFDDAKRVDLYPSQEIDVQFAAPPNFNEVDFFIFEINGVNYK